MMKKTTRIRPVVIRHGGTPRMVSVQEALQHFEYRTDRSRGKSDRELFRGLTR
jgi:hypothetical protein